LNDPVNDSDDIITTPLPTEENNENYTKVKLPSGECVWMECTFPSCPYPECDE
jgi:hypothetical protein